MIEFKDAEGGTHTIVNPAQAIFLGLVVILVIGAISFGIGYIFSKT